METAARTPRPPQLTSIPALLTTFQNEWDALMIETHELKQQLAKTRQELSVALYYNDAGQRVIARLQRERDEARDALARVTISSSKHVGEASDGAADDMVVDGESLPEEIIAKIEETQSRLQSTRKKRPVPKDWATGDQIATYDVKKTADSQFTGAKTLAVDESGDLFLCGDSDGHIGVYDLKQGAFMTRSNVGAGGITGSAWQRDRAVVSTTSGYVVISQGGSVIRKLRRHAGAATAVAVHPSGDIAASVGVDKSLVIYDMLECKVLMQTFTDSELISVAFHPDGHLAAAGTGVGTIILFDVKTGQIVHTFPSNSSPPTPVQAVTFSENGTWLASANANSTSLYIWDLRKTALLKTLDAGTAISGIAWDYTGQFLAACGPGGVVVSQYTKSSKAWSEPLKKAVGAVDVAWGPSAGSLVVLDGEGAVSVLGA